MLLSNFYVLSALATFILAVPNPENAVRNATLDAYQSTIMTNAESITACKSFGSPGNYFSLLVSSELFVTHLLA
jgi:hypothetical protein